MAVSIFYSDKIKKHPAKTSVYPTFGVLLKAKHLIEKEVNILKQRENTYEKPALREMSEIDMTDINGGVGVPVVLAAAVAVAVALAGYTTVAVNAVVGVNVYYALNISVAPWEPEPSRC